jgi:hypothetical protein
MAINSPKEIRKKYVNAENKNPKGNTNGDLYF